MAERWFTPHTARQALSRVRADAERAYRLYRRLEQRGGARIQPEQPVDPCYFALAFRLHRMLATLSRQGLRVQELRCGSLGFPGVGSCATRPCDPSPMPTS